MRCPKDLTGMRFGRLFVLERSGIDSDKRPTWKCQCDCGSIKVITGRNMVNGFTQSCGCIRKDKTANFVGRRFGRLTVIERGTNKDNGRVITWICKCDCGTYTTVRAPHLVNGTSCSCGCLRIERLQEVVTTHGHSIGRVATSEFSIWTNMRSRCRNQNADGYINYGGRGITVCDRWDRSFEAFFEDMGPRPSPRHSIDRINNNGPYAPENCRWATKQEQARNSRQNHLIEIDGVTRCVAEWSEISGVLHSTITGREKAGVVGMDLLKPVRNREAA
jgi:hypothetical protein